MGKEQRVITPDTIESTKMLLSFSNKPESVIELLCMQFKLNEAFVNEFIEYISPKVFSTSYRLEMSLADKFPSLFSEEDYKGEPQTESTEISSGPEYVIPRMSISGLARYLDSMDLKNHCDLVLASVRDADPSEFKDADDIYKLIGLSNNIDKVLLMRCNDTQIADVIAMTLAANNEKITPEVSKYLTDEARKAVLDSSRNIKDFIVALCSSDDLGWQIQAIKDAVKSAEEFSPYGGTLDRALTMLIEKLPEDVICELFKLKELLPNAFNYHIMSVCLERKSFSESQLLSLEDLFFKAGMKIKLKLYAKNHDMEELYEKL